MKYINILIIVATCSVLLSCRKYLSERPNIRLEIPRQIADFQALLDRNLNVEFVTPAVADLGTDDYFLRIVGNLTATAVNSYKWQKIIYTSVSAQDWNRPYSVIYVANVVIEGLDKITVSSPVEQKEWNEAYGHALFLRAYFHHQLEEVFGQPYRPNSASSDLGIPLKLSPDLTAIPTRATTKAVYEQIVSDLLRAKDLLPDFSIAKNKPSKAAALAVLARIHLILRDYQKAREFADASLAINSTLTDYKNYFSAVTFSTSNPFASPGLFAPNQANEPGFETLFYAQQLNEGVFNKTTTFVDTLIFNSYSSNDLRREAFFRRPTGAPWPGPGPYANFKGNYTANAATQFSGIAVDEVYLIRAECHARLGNKDAAMADLNALLAKRWKANASGLPLATPATDEETLKLVLLERRKELLFRGIRWSDLRRLNQDTQTSVILRRKYDNGQVDSLMPNDPKYAYPIPQNEIELSGIPQNPR